MRSYPPYSAAESLRQVTDRARAATPEDPLRILVSACLIGHATGWEGSAYTETLVMQLAALSNVQIVPCCPEDLFLGTPRPFTTCFGGDGYDVVDGHARVMDTTGRDVTQPLLRGAAAMVDVAEKSRVELAILMDISDSCGSNVIYRGDAREKRYQPGPGVAAAMLRRRGFPTLARTEGRSLNALLKLLNPAHEIDAEAIDRIEQPWLQANMPVVRLEEARDHDAVDILVRATFDNEAEVSLVRGLRTLPGAMALVATIDGRVAGHIAFSPLSLPNTMALAPMAVSPDHQRLGIGTQLVRDGLRRLACATTKTVIVLGHPGYYPRFGFKPAPPSLECPWPGAGDAWMVLQLDESEIPTGKPEYAPIFSTVS